MQLSVCPQPFYRDDLDTGLANLRALGFDALELPVDAGSPWLDLDQLVRDPKPLRAALSRHSLRLSAVSIHQESQLLLGPHHADTDAVFAGSATEKAAFARHRMEQAARLAAELEVGIVIGFTGCEDYSRFFPWPAADGFERMWPTLVERLVPVLDAMQALGVRFAHEPHPKQMVYNTETAAEAVRHLDGHPAFGFNLDPANLLLAGVDPVVFVAELGERVLHVHAKDGELVAHQQRRSGLLAHGAWDRKDRGFRFRIPGWGDVPWRRLISELILADYAGDLAIENEDPLFAPDDGLRKARDYLLPLLPRGQRQERWW